MGHNSLTLGLENSKSDSVLKRNPLVRGWALMLPYEFLGSALKPVERYAFVFDPTPHLDAVERPVIWPCSNER